MDFWIRGTPADVSNQADSLMSGHRNPGIFEYVSFLFKWTPRLADGMSPPGNITLGTSTALLPEPDELFEDEDIPFLPLSSTVSVSITNINKELQHFTFLGEHAELVSGWQQKQTQEVHGERNGADKLIPLVQSKLIEHGFSVLDENTVFQAEADLNKHSSDNISPKPSVLQSLLEESIKRVIEVLEQYGRRGQLVQELILRAETAARQNERLTVDNKELALQITDLTKHEHGRLMESGAVCAHATWGSERARKEVMEVMGRGAWGQGSTSHAHSSHAHTPEKI